MQNKMGFHSADESDCIVMVSLPSTWARTDVTGLSTDHQKGEAAGSRHLIPALRLGVLNENLSVGTQAQKHNDKQSFSPAQHGLHNND